MLAYVLLAVGQLAGIALVPFTSVGLWVQLLAIAIYSWGSDFVPLGIVPLVIFITIAAIAELARAPFRTGSVRVDVRRKVAAAGLGGATLGSLSGYFFFPLLGSLFGALVGAALGTIIGSFQVRRKAGGLGPPMNLFLATTLRCAASISIAAFTLASFLG